MFALIVWPICQRSWNCQLHPVWPRNLCRCTDLPCALPAPVVDSTRHLVPRLALSVPVALSPCRILLLWGHPPVHRVLRAHSPLRKELGIAVFVSPENMPPRKER